MQCTKCARTASRLPAAQHIHTSDVCLILAVAGTSAVRSNYLNMEPTFSLGPRGAKLLPNKCLRWDVIGSEPVCP